MNVKCNIFLYTMYSKTFSFVRPIEDPLKLSAKLITTRLYPSYRFFWCYIRHQYIHVSGLRCWKHIIRDYKLLTIQLMSTSKTRIQRQSQNRTIVSQNGAIKHGEEFILLSIIVNFFCCRFCSEAFALCLDNIDISDECGIMFSTVQRPHPSR